MSCWYLVTGVFHPYISCRSHYKIYKPTYQLATITSMDTLVPSPKLTASLPLKIEVWKMKFLLDDCATNSKYPLAIKEIDWKIYTDLCRWCSSCWKKNISNQRRFLKVVQTSIFHEDSHGADNGPDLQAGSA